MIPHSAAAPPKILVCYGQGWKFCIFGQRGCEPKKVKEPKTQEEGKKRRQAVRKKERKEVGKEE